MLPLPQLLLLGVVQLDVPELIGDRPFLQKGPCLLAGGAFGVAYKEHVGPSVLNVGQPAGSARPAPYFTTLRDANQGSAPPLS